MDKPEAYECYEAPGSQELLDKLMAIKDQVIVTVRILCKV